MLSLLRCSLSMVLLLAAFSFSATSWAQEGDTDCAGKICLMFEANALTGSKAGVSGTGEKVDGSQPPHNAIHLEVFRTYYAYERDDKSQAPYYYVLIGPMAKVDEELQNPTLCEVNEKASEVWVQLHEKNWMEVAKIWFRYRGSFYKATNCSNDKNLSGFTRVPLDKTTLELGGYPPIYSDDEINAAISAGDPYGIDPEVMRLHIMHPGHCVWVYVGGQYYCLQH